MNAARRKSEPPDISPWEWLPVLLLPALAVFRIVLDDPEGALSRLTLFVSVGLAPGVIWRVLGRSSWGVHRVFFALSLVAFVVDNPALRPDSRSWRRIQENWPLVSLGFLSSFAQPFLGSLRTHRLLRDSGVGISQYASLRLCLSGTFFNIFLPGANGGDAYRVYALTRGYGTGFAPAIASITLDRLLGLPSLILVVALGMALDYGFLRANRLLGNLIPFIAVAAAVCVVLVGYLAVAGKSRRRADGSAAKSGWTGRAHALIATNVTRRWTLPLALFYGFLSHAACIVSCLCFGEALGVRGVPALRYFLLVPLAMTINSLPGAPGGVGQGELAMATLLDMAAPGLENAQAGVVVMLLFRLSTMATGLWGGAYYALGKRSADGAEAWR